MDREERCDLRDQYIFDLCDELMASTSRPERFIGLHFFNRCR